VSDVDEPPMPRSVERAPSMALARSETLASEMWSVASPRSEWMKSDPPNVPAGAREGGSVEVFGGPAQKREETHR